MGTCISSHIHNKNSGSSKKDQIMSFDHSSIPSTPIKVNDKPSINVDPPPTISFAKSRISPFNSISSYRSLGGSKDETFFDTQGWLDSDCDDDFYSVNGDFTPSRSSTPVHGSGTPRLSRVFSPQVSRAVFDGKPPRSASNLSRGSPSVRQSFSSTSNAQTNGPTSDDVVRPDISSTSITKSKKLIELFRESMRERDGLGFSLNLPPSPSRTPSSPLPEKPAKRAPSSLRYSVSNNDNDVHVKGKSDKFTNRCFPRLSHVRSFSENKKTSSLSTSTDGTKS